MASESTEEQPAQPDGAEGGDADESQAEGIPEQPAEDTADGNRKLAGGRAVFIRRFRGDGSGMGGKPGFKAVMTDSQEMAGPSPRET